MLVEKNVFNRSTSKYKCDRCKTPLAQFERNIIEVGEHGTVAKKKWDLCDSCYKALIRGIRKGK